MRGREQTGFILFWFFLLQKQCQKLRAVKIINPKVNPVAPGIQNVQNEKYSPLSRHLFLYVNDQQLRANKTFRRFVSHYLRNMGSLVKRTNYIPLPESTYRLVDSKLYRHVLGTSFGGDLPIGLTIGQAIDRSFDQHKKPRHR